MHKTIISPGGNSFKIPWKELWQYRELLGMLAWRDFRVKYAQTFLGVLWTIINPIFTVFILTFVFGTIAKVDTGGIPHPLYTLAGLCGWTYFAALTSSAGNSIIAAQHIVKKIYFPRLVIPLSKALSCVVDLIIVLICLFALMVIYQIPPSEHFLWLPFFIFMALLTGLAAGIWMSALTIRFRDFQHITPLLLRLGMYATPIAYSANAVPDNYQVLFYINPMAGVIEGIRWSILGGISPPPYIWISFGVVGLLFLGGLFYFNKIEKTIADIL